MLRKLVPLTLLVAVLSAIALPVGADAAPTSQVSIEPNAQWSSFGFVVEVQLHVRCDPGIGFVQVQVSQAPPESTFPTSGMGGSNPVCDGQEHQVGVGVASTGGPFDIGKAFATATLFAPNQPFPTTASKTINITF